MIKFIIDIVASKISLLYLFESKLLFVQKMKCSIENLKKYNRQAACLVCDERENYGLCLPQAGR
jgi:hypothetical protein